MHNLATALVGPDRRLVWTWPGNDWMPEDLLEVGKQTLEDSTVANASQE